MEVGKYVFETENWRFWVGASSVTSPSSRAIMYLEAAISSGFFFTASVMIDLKQKKKNPFPTLLRLGNQGNVVCLVWETETRKKKELFPIVSRFFLLQKKVGEKKRCTQNISVRIFLREMSCFRLPEISSSPFPRPPRLRSWRATPAARASAHAHAQ